MTSTIETRNKTNTEAIGAWHTALTTGAPLTQRETRLILSAINDTLLCRDALVLSFCDDRLTRAQLEHMTEMPYDSRSNFLMYDVLSQLFHGALTPNPVTAERAANLLDQLIQAATGRQAAQPLAIRSWLAWITDDFTAAKEYANQSLTIDGDITLPGIVLFGVQRNIHVGEAA